MDRETAFESKAASLGFYGTKPFVVHIQHAQEGGCLRVHDPQLNITLGEVSNNDRLLALVREKGGSVKAWFLVAGSSELKVAMDRLTKPAE